MRRLVVPSRRRIRNLSISFRNGFLGIGYSLLLPVALLLEFILIVILAVLFGKAFRP